MYPVIFVLCGKADLFVWWGGGLWTTWDGMLRKLAWPILWSFNRLFVPFFDPLHLVTGGPVDNQDATSYLTLLPFWFLACGLVCGLAATFVWRRLKCAGGIRTAESGGIHPAAVALLYVCATFVVFAFARKIACYDGFWVWWPQYRWYLTHGIVGAVLLSASLIVGVVFKKTRLSFTEKMSCGGQCILLALSVFVALPPSNRALCGYNLMMVSSALANGAKLEANGWCDQFLPAIPRYSDDDNGRIFFSCPCDQRSAAHGCSYALNPASVTASDPETVMLFEAETQWNSVGGKEIMALDRHRGGCWVVLKNMERRFVGKRDAASLKWE